MVLNLIARCDWPAQTKPFTLESKDGNVNVKEIKETVAKTLSLSTTLASRSLYYAIEYGHDVIELGHGEENKEYTVRPITVPKDVKLVNGMTIVVATPSDSKPLPRGLAIEKEEKDGEKSKKKSNKRPNQVYIGLTPENVLEKYTGSAKQKRIVLEYIDMEIAKIVSTKAWLSIDESLLITILKSDALNAPESTLFDGILAWGKHKSTSTSTPTSTTEVKEDPEQLKVILKDILPLIRFPLMTTQDVAVKVNPSGVLDSTQILELFTYLGVLETNKKGAKLGPSIAHFNTKKRIGRRPPGWFKWDPEKKYAQLTLSDEDTTVSCTSTSYYQSIFGNVELEDGVHEWEITLEQLYQHQFGCIIGIVPASFTNYTVSQMIGYPGHIPGWGYSVGGAQKFHSEQLNYGTTCNNGDVVKVKLDLDAGTLEYFVNGTSQGNAYTDIQGPVRPAVSLYGSNTIKLKHQ